MPALQFQKTMNDPINAGEKEQDHETRHPIQQ